MRTLEEHFDDLDRMVDNGTSVAKTREQISFVWSQVSALQKNYANLIEEHEDLKVTTAAKIAELNEKHLATVAKLNEKILKLEKLQPPSPPLKDFGDGFAGLAHTPIPGI